MSWSEAHKESELYAIQAHEAARNGDVGAAQQLFVLAADNEAAALQAIDSDKPRTLGIIAISAAALYYKGREFDRAAQIAHQYAARGDLPAFAKQELRNLLQAIWNEQAQKESGIAFAPGQVVVSVKGGQVVTGGAPLDLIVSKVQDIQSIFYRTAEMLIGRPFRAKGPPSKDIQDKYRPWLFQTVPGSYQFIVAVQKPEQQELFPSGDVEPERLTETFLSIVQAGASDPESLDRIVPDASYRKTLLKLTQNLAPTGKAFESIELRGPSDLTPIVLTTESRKHIREHLRPPAVTSNLTEEVISGVLRAVHLEKDWLEIVPSSGPALKVTSVGEVVDDVIGPMINHAVKVTVRRDPKRPTTYSFVDIEMDS